MHLRDCQSDKENCQSTGERPSNEESPQTAKVARSWRVASQHGTENQAKETPDDATSNHSQCIRNGRDTTLWFNTIAMASVKKDRGQKCGNGRYKPEKHEHGKQVKYYRLKRTHLSLMNLTLLKLLAR